jgi:HNH endonuclease
MTFGALHNEVIGSHTRNEWLKVLEDQGHACIWCGRSITDLDEAKAAGVKLTRAEKATPEHIVPKSRRGVDFIWNIVASCYPCNEKRGNKLPGEFLRDRPAFNKPPVDKKKNSTRLSLVKGRDRSGQIEVTEHLEISNFAAQCVRSLDAKMPTIERSDEWYRQRRKLLAEQVVRQLPRLFKSPDQLKLPLSPPRPQAKPPKSDLKPATRRKESA